MDGRTTANGVTAKGKGYQTILGSPSTKRAMLIYQRPMFIITACIAAACASLPPQEVQEGRPAVSSLDREVLSTVLARVSRAMGDRYLVVAAQPTSQGIDQEWLHSHLTKSDSNIDLDEMLTDYRARNAKNFVLPSLGAKVHLADAQQLHLVFGRGELEGWKQFKLVFPGAAALVQISLPGYSVDGSWAITCIFVATGVMAGDESVVLLHRVAGIWRVEWSDIAAST